MSEHTPEPRSIGCVGLLGIDGNLTTTIIKLTPEGMIYPAICQAPVSEESEASARHIVACVNNCEGINPKAVPGLLHRVRARAFFCSCLESNRCKSCKADLAAITKAEKLQ